MPIPMAQLPPIKKSANIKSSLGLTRLTAEVNTDIEELNKLITEYNSIDGHFKKIEYLKKMVLYKQKIENKYSDTWLAESYDFARVIHGILFQEIEKQAQSIGYTSLYQFARDNSLISPTSHELQEILINMSAEKAAQFMEILSKGETFDKKSLNNLYKKDEKGWKEYQEFLKNNNISFYGGENAKNFLITPKSPHNSNAKLILKVDNRLGNANSAAAFLKDHSLQDTLTKTFAQRQVTGRQFGFGMIRMSSLPPYEKIAHLVKDANLLILVGDKVYIADNNEQQQIYEYTGLGRKIEVLDTLKEKVTSSYQLADQESLELIAIALDGFPIKAPELATRNLVLSEFCAGTDLKTYRKNMGSFNILASAFNIYTQMGTVLTGINRDGCAFTDMKNANWLLDETGKLRIADTKSLVFTSGGMLDQRKAQEQWLIYAFSEFMKPPECIQNRVIDVSADKMHTYMLGKNLYQYLTGCDDEELSQKSFDFNYPIFDTPEGRELQALIVKMIEEKPSNRISMSEALAQLKIMQQEFDFNAQKKACFGLLDEIKKNAFPDYEHDKYMHEFVEKQYAALYDAKSVAAIMSIKTELLKLAMNPEIIAIKETIVTLKNKNESSANTKVDYINTAMNALPIEQRATLLQASEEGQQQVLKVLALQRGSINYKENKDYKEIAATVSLNNPADSFKNFKKRAEQLKAEQRDPGNVSPFFELK